MSEDVLTPDGKIDVIATLIAALPEAKAAQKSLDNLKSVLDAMNDDEKHAHLLSQIKTAAQILTVSLAVASGAGILPTSVIAFGPPTIAAVQAFIKALESKT